jgi:hypothetical protein
MTLKLLHYDEYFVFFFISLQKGRKHEGNTEVEKNGYVVFK